MKGRFRKMLEANHNLPLKEQKKLLEKTFNEWKGNSFQLDDILVMGIKIF